MERLGTSTRAVGPLPGEGADYTERVNLVPAPASEVAARPGPRTRVRHRVTAHDLWMAQIRWLRKPAGK